GPAARCASARRSNFPCAIALCVASEQAAHCANDRTLNRPHSMNCALRHMHLRVAPDT
ncbi:hypothetical protein A2U01_0104865, partial [Trifolium medium]|nr:hypothetical protein [Trifolium medium]